MTRLKQTLLLALTASVAAGAIAFAQTQSKMDAAAPAVGSAAPAYALPDQTGKTHTLADDKGKVVLLAFYPKDFTGGCTLEAHSLTSAYPRLKAMGVVVYGVSVQDAQSHQSFCSKEGIPYPLLADTDKQLTTAYGDLIPGVGLANRVTYIINADGKVAYVDQSVNSHLNTCGADWVDWIKAHPSIMTKAPIFQSASPLSSLTAAQIFANRAVLGHSVPAFTLADAATDQQTSLTALSEGKKAAVVMFISTRCPISNAYNERMTALAQKYSAQGVAFVGIDSDQNEPKAEIGAFTKDKGFPFPVLVDVGNKVSDMYQAHVTPETYVIDNKGILVYHGRIDNDMDTSNVKTHELADALDATLAGKPVAKAQTKAFGCSIKR